MTLKADFCRNLYGPRPGGSRGSLSSNCLSLCLDVIQLAITIESTTMFDPRLSVSVMGR